MEWYTMKREDIAKVFEKWTAAAVADPDSFKPVTEEEAAEGLVCQSSADYFIELLREVNPEAEGLL